MGESDQSQTVHKPLGHINFRHLSVEPKMSTITKIELFRASRSSCPPGHSGRSKQKDFVDITALEESSEKATCSDHR